MKISKILNFCKKDEHKVGSPDLRFLQWILHFHPALRCLKPLHSLHTEVLNGSRECGQLAHSQRFGWQMGGLRGKIDVGSHNLRWNLARYRHFHSEFRMDYVRVGLGMGVLPTRLATHDMGSGIRRVFC